ncbi:hypothetical protein FFLO_03274 [Filobasidium floriforme]|uniref:Uncharacterized protein n=1 Tax=Filobasidium floriforme TaxID=5210 RepID=A0A8K0JL87_9TREE|nr:uncharacterized protein HD553DRAFT_346041 [Filobasidium floriforme]KAG7544313.1 hypothetical protein FFLO_03274 [Filobasidium floriforme]KAH8078657.1 hypothetical protein HD553DRAFT_346041 [Filobasidium floriforme]
MSSNTLSQYPSQNRRKRRGSNSLENSNYRLAASNQTSITIDHASLPLWHGTVTNGAHVESSHEDTLSPSAASYATNLHLPETSFYDFGPPADSYADRIPVDTSGFGWNTMPPVPTVPSQRLEDIRELAPTARDLYRGDQQGQTLPSALPLHLASHFTTAAEDNSGNQRFSYSSRQYPADTVSTGPVSISAAFTASGAAS